jgi:hypothetical protein
MEGGRTFDIDAFLEFMPGQEGEAWEKREEHHPSVLPLSTAPLAPEKIFFILRLYLSSSGLQRAGAKDWGLS